MKEYCLNCTRKLKKKRYFDNDKVFCDKTCEAEWQRNHLSYDQLKKLEEKKYGKEKV